MCPSPADRSRATKAPNDNPGSRGASAVWARRSAICMQPSAIRVQPPSAISAQPSAISAQRSGVCQQPSTPCSQASASEGSPSRSWFLRRPRRLHPSSASPRAADRSTAPSRCRALRVACSIRFSPISSSAPSDSSGKPPIRTTGWSRIGYPTPSVLEHRRGRVRTDDIPHRRRARLRHARGGAAARRSRRCVSSQRARRARGARGVAGYHGFFYHFLDMKTGARFEDSELSTVDTAHPARPACCSASRTSIGRIRKRSRNPPTLPTTIYRRVDWRWAQMHAPAISHRLVAGRRLPRYDWRGYNEAMLVYVLALGSPTHAVGHQCLDRVDEHLRQDLGHGIRHRNTSASRRCSDTSTRTSGSISATSRTTTCASAGSTISRTAAARSMRSTPTRSPIRWRWRIYGATSGASPRATDLPTSSSDYAGSRARLPQLCGARRRIAMHRRLHARADRRGGFASRSRRRSRFPRSRRCTDRFGEHIYSKYGFLDAFNPSFIPTTSAQPRARRPGLRLGRRRLYRHRPGPDLRDDRELPQRSRSGGSCARIRTFAAACSAPASPAAGSTASP